MAEGLEAIDVARDVEPVPSNAEPRRMSSEPGAIFDESDYRSHHNVYVAVHIPYSAPRKHKHRKHQHHTRHHGNRRNSEPLLPSPDHAFKEPKTPLDPCDRVKFILGAGEGEKGAGGDGASGGATSHTIFTELEELNEKMEWKETARWVKFEEDVEEGGDKWSKPHVASLSLHSLFQLRSCILKGTVLLDLAANNLEQISDYVLDDLVLSKQLDSDKRDMVRTALLQRHKHQGEKDHEHRFLPHIRSFGDLKFGRSPENGSGHKLGNGNGSSEKGGVVDQDSSSSQQHGTHLHPNFPFSMPNMLKGVRPKKLFGSWSDHGSANSIGRNASDEGLPSAASMAPKNPHFMKKIPAGSEASNVLVGEVDFLDHPIIAFVRLSQGEFLGDLTEVPIPTRFLFILLGPRGNRSKYHEIGRSIATLMSDEVFHDVAYKARNRDDLLAGVDEFLDKVTVLPPGEWDPHIRLEPPSKIPSQSDRRMATSQDKDGKKGKEEDGAEDHKQSLTCSKWPFNGLVRDIKRRYPRYLSDITDSISLQAVASIIFIYFANIPPAITFGGVLSARTENHLGPLEMILAVGIGNFIFSLFAGQPLVVLGGTGPTLIFEDIVYRFCSQNGLPYLNFRFWIGTWTAIMMIGLVACNASAIMRLFTRFTEEIFSSLISFIFIYEAFDVLFRLRGKHCGTIGSILFTCWENEPSPSNLSSCSLDFLSLEPINSDHYSYVTHCSGRNGTILWSYFNRSEAALLENATSIVSSCAASYRYQYQVDPFYVGRFLQFLPDVSFSPDDAFLMSIILFVGTFFTSFYLKKIRETGFFTAFIRRMISDFAVPIAVVIWVVVNILTNYHTCTLDVPNVFEEGLYSKGSGRNGSEFLINPFGNGLPGWAPVAAIIPAILATILLFMDQQITALIVNRKDNRLKKGSGYHLDLLIVGILIFLHSLLGLPWVVGATVRSITHVQSLFIYSPTSAPGERPKFLGVREQRVTLFFMSILLCLSVVAFKALQLLPDAVLYGIFLYIGVASLYGVQFVQRLLLFIIPDKYKPDYEYLRHIPNRRIYLYTLIQIVFLGLLCVFKVVSQISIVFPVMVLLLVFGRWIVGFLFSRRDMEILDDPISEKLYCKRFRSPPTGPNTSLMESGDVKEEESGERESSITPHPSSIMGLPSVQEDVDGEAEAAKSPTEAKRRTSGGRLKMAGHASPSSSTARKKGADEINMTKEVDQCHLWKSLVQEYSSPPTASPSRSRKQPLPGSHEGRERGSSSRTSRDQAHAINPLILNSSQPPLSQSGPLPTFNVGSPATIGVELPPPSSICRSTAV